MSYFACTESQDSSLWHKGCRAHLTALARQWINSLSLQARSGRTRALLTKTNPDRALAPSIPGCTITKGHQHPWAAGVAIPRAPENGFAENLVFRSWYFLYEKNNFWNILSESWRELVENKFKERQELWQLTQLFFLNLLRWNEFTLVFLHVFTVCSFQFVSLENISLMWSQLGVLKVTQVF